MLKNEKYRPSYFSNGNGQRRESALCQLYRHTFVPYFESHGIEVIHCSKTFFLLNIQEVYNAINLVT